MRDREIRFQRAGALVEIVRPSGTIQRVLERELTYNFVRHLRGQEAKYARSPVQILPTKCYKHVVDPDGVFPPKILFPAGYMPRVARAFKGLGYRVLVKNKTPSDKRKELYKPRWERLRPVVQFRYRQHDLLEKMVASTHGGQLVCPTGYGKGLMIRCFCQLLPHAKIDISTHSLDVLDQIYTELSAAIPEVGIDCSARQREGGGRITLYSGKSIHHSDGTADVLIVDEGHEWGTADYIARLARYRNARRFMFSASPIRSDGSHFELEGAFGPPLIWISYQEAVEHGCIVPIHVKMVDVIMDTDPADGYSDTARDRNGIWRNRVRNEIIADEAHALGDDEQTLITVKTLEHAAFLKRLLPEYTLCYSAQASYEDFQRYISWGLLPPKEPFMDNERRRMLKEKFECGKLKKVIATPVWNRGVNFQDLAVLLRADAANSRTLDTQIPGRTARLPNRTDKEFGRVIDLLDQFNPAYRRYAQGRVTAYRSYEWEVELPASMQRLRQKYIF